MALSASVAETTLVRGQDHQKDAVRSVKTEDGAVIVEKLQAHHVGAHSMRYEIVESPLRWPIMCQR